MAREKEKKGYQGPKVSWDSKTNRDEARRRVERAQKNADGRQTNDMFAASDTAFRKLCEDAGINPTARQASKFRNGYGLAARKNGSSLRKDPRA